VPVRPVRSDDDKSVPEHLDPVPVHDRVETDPVRSERLCGRGEQRVESVDVDGLVQRRQVGRLVPGDGRHRPYDGHAERVRPVPVVTRPASDLLVLMPADRRVVSSLHGGKFLSCTTFADT